MSILVLFSFPRIALELVRFGVLFSLGLLVFASLLHSTCLFVLAFYYLVLVVSLVEACFPLLHRGLWRVYRWGGSALVSSC